MTRKRIVRTIVELVLFGIIISALVSLVVSFPVMLVLGALHTQWIQVPAFGWWTTYAIFFALSSVTEISKVVLFDSVTPRTRAHKLS
jgi:hypothetical protein